MKSRFWLISGFFPRRHLGNAACFHSPPLANVLRVKEQHTCRGRNDGTFRKHLAGTTQRPSSIRSEQNAAGLGPRWVGKVIKQFIKFGDCIKFGDWKLFSCHFVHTRFQCPEAHNDCAVYQRAITLVSWCVEPSHPQRITSRLIR